MTTPAVSYVPARPGVRIYPAGHVEPSRTVTLLMVAVSRNAVAVASDSLWVEVDANGVPNASRTGVRKTFAGPAVVTGMAGTADTPAGSLLSLVEALATHATDVPHAVRALNETTRATMPHAIAAWRRSVRPSTPVNAFATVVAGGLHPTPHAVVLQPTTEQGHWATVGQPLLAGPTETDIAAFGTIPDAAGRYCGGWLDVEAGRIIDALSRGQEPPPFPTRHAPVPATASAVELEAHLRKAIADGLADDNGIVAAPGWPPTQPLIGGAAQSVSIEGVEGVR